MESRHDRRLFWVPVIHTPADLGSLSESVRHLHVQAFGKGRWDHRIRKIEEIWDRIRASIDALNLEWTKVRLYQDGLPCCGKEADIVRDLARAGSQNHQILLDLMARGASLTGTESTELLLEEYELARQMLAAANSGHARRDAQRQQELSKVLLERRDRFIAERIEQTLAAGETGLLFLGMLHQIEGRVSPGIEVIRLGQDPDHASEDTSMGTAKRRRPRS